MNRKELFNELNEILLKSNKPSDDFKRLILEGKFNKYPLNKISMLQNIDQNLKYHPEGNVLNHIFLVIDNASKYKELSKDQKVFMWSALLHDIGKLTTTKIRKGKITSYNHDIEGEAISLKILNELNDDIEFNKKVSKLVRYHMQPLFYDKNLPFFSPNQLFEETDYIEVALLSLCDRLGRGNMDKDKEAEEKIKIDKFVNYYKGNKNRWK